MFYTFAFFLKSVEPKSRFLMLGSLFFICFSCQQSAIGGPLLQSHPAPPPSPSSQWHCRAAPSQPKTCTLTAAVRPTASRDAAIPLTVSVASAQAVWRRGPSLHQLLYLLWPLHPLQALFLLFQPLETCLPLSLSPTPPLPHLPYPKMTPWALWSP